MHADSHINVSSSDADGGYIAEIPDLESWDAVVEVMVARDAWLAAARETGREVPPPCNRPAIYAG